MNKVIKNKNEIFASQTEVDEFLAQRNIEEPVTSIRMDKTFYLNKPPGMLDQIVVEFDHSMCHRIKFKVNSEGINV